jgi:NAD(P)-dependent dehydrogenase (short-subunit alcohol dehydrogenase family)
VKIRLAGRQNTSTAEAICTSGQLKGRVAVITGASSGVGRAISLSLAREAFRVYAIGRNVKALEKTDCSRVCVRNRLSNGSDA